MPKAGGTPKAAPHISVWKASIQLSSAGAAALLPLCLASPAVVTAALLGEAIREDSRLGTATTGASINPCSAGGMTASSALDFRLVVLLAERALERDRSLAASVGAFRGDARRTGELERERAGEGERETMDCFSASNCAAGQRLVYICSNKARVFFPPIPC